MTLDTRLGGDRPRRSSRRSPRGERVLLLITGHHRPGEPPVERGKIRAAVHDWLAASRHAPRIAAVRGAHRRHGGGGSLYLVLRRRADAFLTSIQLTRVRQAEHAAARGASRQ